jgi:hypothetical protein
LIALVDGDRGVLLLFHPRDVQPSHGPNVE